MASVLPRRPVRLVIGRGLRRLHDVRMLNRAAVRVARRAFPRRAPTWLARRLRPIGVVEISVEGGATLRLVSRTDDPIPALLFWRGPDGYEESTARVLLTLARTASVVLDVGAYDGCYALLAAAVSREARVVAFEPNPDLADLARENVALNPHLRVEVVEAAVGERAGRAPLHLGGPGLPSSSSLDDAWRGLHRSIEVDVVDLDSFCEARGLTRVDLVKIDVEAMEPSVIAGMRHVLATSRPAVISEVFMGDTVEAQERYDEMAETLRALDFRIFAIGGDGLVEVDRLRQRREPNHLLWPRERPLGALERQ